MIAAAELPHPLRGRQTVYRGTARVAPEIAAQGLSCTTSHEVTCWFACRHSEADAVVLSVDVQGSKIIYWSNERYEPEVVLRLTPPVQLDNQRDR